MQPAIQQKVTDFPSQKIILLDGEYELICPNKKTQRPERGLQNSYVDIPDNKY